MSDAPTTWVSRPVCATEAMIEAGIAAIRRFIHHPADVERRIVKAAVNAALEASPRPPENDPKLETAQMDDEFTDALLKAGDDAYGAVPIPSPPPFKVMEWAFLAVARVALERAAGHLRAEAAGRMAGLKTSEDRDTSHLVIGLLRSMADEVEGLLPVEGPANVE